MRTSTWTVYESPLGPLTLVGSATGVTGLHFPGRGGPFRDADHDPAPLADACAQLEEYFEGERREFDLRLDLAGTAFQRRVWDELARIPYGATTSYSALAGAIGRPDRVRAVAAAIGRTPVPIVVPCHRAVAADGGLTGYLGGLQRKRALLDLEADVAQGHAPEPAWLFRQLELA